MLTRDEGDCGVSIHAPREGCDTEGPYSPHTAYLFQFTHPGRGATGKDALNGEYSKFQFTHPGRGATDARLCRLFAVYSFNSRTPGGVRLRVHLLGVLISSFNSRTPGGVRHAWHIGLASNR